MKARTGCREPAPWDRAAPQITRGDAAEGGIDNIRVLCLDAVSITRGFPASVPASVAPSAAASAAALIAGSVAAGRHSPQGRTLAARTRASPCVVCGVCGVCVACVVCRVSCGVCDSANDCDNRYAMSVLSALAGHLLRRGRRVPRQGFTQLTSKTGPIGYYKGRGSAKEGRHTSKGKYVIQEWKLMRVGGRYGVHGGEGGEGLKPYVGHR